MSKSIWFLLLGLAFAGCTKTLQPVCMPPGHLDDGACTTAIPNIIASPDSYDGKSVSVLGFVDVLSGVNGETILLYPSRDARALQTATVAVQVQAEGRQLELIRGRHRVDAPAHVTGVFTRAAPSRGVLGEIRVSQQ